MISGYWYLVNVVYYLGYLLRKICKSTHDNFVEFKAASISFEITL